MRKLKSRKIKHLVEVTQVVRMGLIPRSLTWEPVFLKLKFFLVHINDSPNIAKQGHGKSTSCTDAILLYLAIAIHLFNKYWTLTRLITGILSWTCIGEWVKYVILFNPCSNSMMSLTDLTSQWFTVSVEARDEYVFGSPADTLQHHIAGEGLCLVLENVDIAWLTNLSSENLGCSCADKRCTEITDTCGIYMGGKYCY